MEQDSGPRATVAVAAGCGGRPRGGGDDCGAERLHGERGAGAVEVGVATEKVKEREREGLAILAQPVERGLRSRLMQLFLGFPYKRYLRCLSSAYVRRRPWILMSFPRRSQGNLVLGY